MEFTLRNKIQTLVNDIRAGCALEEPHDNLADLMQEAVGELDRLYDKVQRLESEVQHSSGDDIQWAPDDRTMPNPEDLHEALVANEALQKKLDSATNACTFWQGRFDKLLDAFSRK